MEERKYSLFLDEYLIKNISNGERVFDAETKTFQGFSKYKDIIIAYRDAEHDYGDYSPSDVKWLSDEEGLVILASKLSKAYHEGQKDKAGKDYYLHPKHVADHCDNPYEKMVAYLHDVMEDCGVSEKMLQELEFPTKVIEAIKLLTHDKNEDYFEYVKKVKLNPLAAKVKLEDLKHNSDLSRLKKVTDKDLERIEKYKTAMKILEIKNF